MKINKIPIPLQQNPFVIKITDSKEPDWSKIYNKNSTYVEPEIMSLDKKDNFNNDIHSVQKVSD